MKRVRWAPEVLVALCAHLLVVVTNGAANNFDDGMGGRAPATFALFIVLGFPIMLLLLATPILLLNLLDRRIQKKRQGVHRDDNTVFGQFLIRQQRDAFYASAAVAYAGLLFAGQFERLREVVIVLAVAAALTVVIHVRLFIISFRVSAGLFGSDEREAREIIHFALAERGDSDMSGGLGAKHMTPSAGASHTAPLPGGAPV